MMRRVQFLSAGVLALCLIAETYAANKLEATKKAPDGLSKDITARLDANGHRVTGSKGTIVEVWFAKSVPTKSGFKPTLSVKYPFTPGELIGAIRVPKGKTYTDFRGQEFKPGVYTLRYGQQPQDGNHIGTSELSDFLLALPAKMDTDPKRINLVDLLHKKSAKSVGATHPAIFSLLPAGKQDKPKLTHDEDKELWVLSASVGGEKKTSISLRLVVVGKAAE